MSVIIVEDIYRDNGHSVVAIRNRIFRRKEKKKLESKPLLDVVWSEEEDEEKSTAGLEWQKLTVLRIHAIRLQSPWLWWLMKIVTTTFEGWFFLNFLSFCRHNWFSDEDILKRYHQRTYITDYNAASCF